MYTVYTYMAYNTCLFKFVSPIIFKHLSKFLGRTLHTVLLEYFAVGEKPLRISQIGNPLRSNYCVLARIVCIYPKLGFAILLFKNSHNYARKHSSNTVTVRSVVIMVVGLQVWGYGHQQGSSEEGYTQ